jgi:hypothetical protein
MGERAPGQRLRGNAAGIARRGRAGTLRPAQVVGRAPAGPGATAARVAGWLEVLVPAGQHGRAHLDERRAQGRHRHCDRGERGRRRQAAHDASPAELGRADGARHPRGPAAPGLRAEVLGPGRPCPVTGILPGPVPAPGPEPRPVDSVHDDAERQRVRRPATRLRADTVKALSAGLDLLGCGR